MRREELEEFDVIKVRNNQVARRIRFDLQEIAEELAGRADKTADMLNRLQRTLAKTPVFTVSTKAFMKLRGVGIQRREYPRAQESRQIHPGE